MSLLIAFVPSGIARDDGNCNRLVNQVSIPETPDFAFGDPGFNPSPKAGFSDLEEGFFFFYILLSKYSDNLNV
jgi:hypothetical protein